MCLDDTPITASQPTKTCRICCKEKPESEYTPSRWKRKYPECRACRAIEWQARQAGLIPRQRHRPYVDAELGVTVKRCTQCETAKPLNQFYPGHNGNAPYRCIQCQLDRAREEYQADSEYRKQRQRNYTTANWDKIIAYRRERLERMTFEEREQDAARMREYRLNWIRKNPDTARQMHIDAMARRRARMQGAFISPIDYEAILGRDGNVCYLCMRQLTRDQTTFDHVVPLARGGAHDQDNLRVCCKTCNSRKKDKLLSELDLRRFRYPDNASKMSRGLSTHPADEANV